MVYGKSAAPNEADLFSCIPCGKTFKRDEDLFNHLCSSGHPYCFYCGLNKPLTHSLSYHLKTNHSNFTCPDCSREFFLRNPWKNHMSSHWQYQEPRRLFLHDVMVQGESLQDFADRLCPSKEFYEQCSEIIRRIEKFLKRNNSFKNGSILMAGSMGKGTALRNGSDLDLVYYLNDTSLDDMLQCLPNKINRLRQHILYGNFKWASGLQFEKTTQYSVQFKLSIRNKPHIPVDLLPVVDILKRNTKTNKEELYARMNTMGRRKQEYCKRCLNKVQVDFVSQVPCNLKDVIRVIKSWVKKIKKDERCSSVLSVFCELVVIRTWMNQGEPGNQDIDLLKFVKLVLYELCFCETIRITWPELYLHHDFIKEIDGPMVLDPATPFSNVAPNIHHAAVISREARQLILGQNYSVISVPECNTPRPNYASGTKHRETSVSPEIGEQCQTSIFSVPEPVLPQAKYTREIKQTEPSVSPEIGEQRKTSIFSLREPVSPQAKHIRETKHDSPEMNGERHTLLVKNKSIISNHEPQAKYTRETKHTELSVSPEMGGGRQTLIVQNNTITSHNPENVLPQAKYTRETKHTELSVSPEMGGGRQTLIVQNNTITSHNPENVLPQAKYTRGTKQTEPSVSPEMEGKRQTILRQNDSMPSLPEPESIRFEYTSGTRYTEPSVILEMEGQSQGLFEQNYSNTSVSKPENYIKTKYTEPSVILEMEGQRQYIFEPNFHMASPSASESPEAMDISETIYREPSVILEMEGERQYLFEQNFHMTSSSASESLEAMDISEMEGERQDLFEQNYSITSYAEPEYTYRTMYNEPSVFLDIEDATQLQQTAVTSRKASQLHSKRPFDIFSELDDDLEDISLDSNDDEPPSTMQTTIPAMLDTSFYPLSVRTPEKESPRVTHISETKHKEPSVFLKMGESQNVHRSQYFRKYPNALSKRSVVLAVVILLVWYFCL